MKSFLGMARLRGMECRAPYAEAFSCAKSVLLVVALDTGGRQARGRRMYQVRIFRVL